MSAHNRCFHGEIRKKVLNVVISIPMVKLKSFHTVAHTVKSERIDVDCKKRLADNINKFKHFHQFSPLA